jgi:uncharacterized protein (DUF488 family)
MPARATNNHITGCLYSVGHGTRSAKTFLSLLHSFKIEHLADIRSYPGSRRHPQFSRKNLQATLKKESISYTWFPDLGGFRREGLGSESPHTALTSNGLRNYADHMATDSFRSAVKKLRTLAQTGPTCFMCAETLPQKCHRLLLSDYLLMMDLQVIHILDKENTTVHRLSRWALRGEKTVVYKRSEVQQLES